MYGLRLLHPVLARVFPELFSKPPVGDTIYSVSYSVKVTLTYGWSSAFVDRLSVLGGEGGIRTHGTL